MRTPREILDLLKRFEESESFDDLPRLSIDELRPFLAELTALCDEPYLGAYADHWFADAAMLAFIHDREATEAFLALTRYYE